MHGLVRSLLYCGLAAGSALGYVIPYRTSWKLISRQDGDPKMVFAHFMVGIVGNRISAADYDEDMKRAKAVGIDAFALNIGNEQPERQLGFAYESAAKNGMKAFISFDCNFFPPGQEGVIGNLINQFADSPAQLKVAGGKPFVSTFIGDNLNVDAIRSSAGREIFYVPNFHPGQGDFNKADGVFNFQGWPSNGLNKAPSGGQLVTVDAGDQTYLKNLNGKSYMAPVSPWFFTHFGGEVPFSKNWVFPSELLIFKRWQEILALKPSFTEIVTWNDYGESHYIGPLAGKHTDDGASKWANDMPHNGWADLSAPFIAAYKAGASTPDDFITDEKIIYWYRITPKGLDCDATDTTFGPGNNATGDFFNGRPNGFETLADDVFVVTFLKTPGKITVNSGGTLYTFDAPAGASAFNAPFKVGAQAFALNRDGNEVMAATSLKPIQDTCPCGLYNFNSYVGTVPEGPRDVLPADSFGSFKNGLKTACDATPSLAVTPPAPTAPTATVVVTAAPTTPAV